MPLKSVRGNVWGVTAAAVPVELRLEADDLPNRDTLSLSDPFAVVSSTHFGGGYEEIGRTETVWDELNPRWATALPLQYVPGINATALRIDVYDLDTEDGEELEKQDFLGTTYTTLAAVLNADDGVLTLPLVDRDENGDDEKTAAAAAAAAAAAVTPVRRAPMVRRKRATWGLGTLRLSAEVVHLQLRSEHALAAATAAVAHPARPPRSPHRREGPHSAGGPASARRPPSVGGSPLAAAKALVPPRALSGPRVTQPCLSAVTGDADAAAVGGGPVPAEWSFCVTVPPVYRRGVLGRSPASLVWVVERQRPSGGGWSTLYHTAALDKEAFAATGAGHYRAATFAAATLHNGNRRRPLRFSFHDYHMRSANVRICEATLSFDQLLTAAPSAAWPLMGAESPTTQVGTMTITALRATRGGVAVPAGGGGAAADTEAAAAAAASSPSAAAMAVAAGGPDAKATLLAAVGDAGTDGVELDVRVEWSALASPTFLGGSVAAAKATADADGGCLGAAGGDGSGDSAVSWAGPRPFAGRRPSKRLSAAWLDAGGWERGGAPPDAASPGASPRVSVPPPNGGAAAAFPTHAPFRPNGSLSTKLAQSLKKSMALH